MTLGLTDTSPGPAGEVTRDTTWPRRVTVTCHVSRVTGHVMPDWVTAAGAVSASDGGWCWPGAGRDPASLSTPSPDGAIAPTRPPVCCSAAVLQCLLRGCGPLTVSAAGHGAATQLQLRASYSDGDEGKVCSKL